MPKIELFLDDTVADFYRKIALQAGLPLEQVLSDALFKLAGQLSLDALHQRAPQQGKRS